MRIRKNAKISPLVYALSSGIVLQPHVCQLNQSPWDVIDFSPPPPSPPSQVINGSAGSAGNGSSGRFIPASEREFNSEVYKTDGNSWLDGDDHLLLVNSSHHATKKPAKAAGEARRAHRKKAPSSAPDDFYYYSGFGPRWAKKRGESSRNNQEIRMKNENEIEVSENVEYQDDDEEEEKEVGKKRGRKPIKARSLKSLM